MLLEEIEDTFGDSFPLHKYMRLLEREREHYESSISSATNVRSVKALMGGQSTPSRWLINDMLPEGLYLVSDTQKIGISWFNVALGLTISGSAPVLGSNMRMRHGNVFYLSLEENEDQLHERLMNFLVSGVSLAEDFEYATTWPRLHPDGVTALEEWLHMHPRARLIIIDSWKKIKPVVTTKTGDTAQIAEYEALIGLKYLVDTYNIGILLYPRSARTPSAKTSSEPYGVTGVASCADGFLTLKQGKDQSEALLSAIWKSSRKGVHHSAEFRRDAWQSVKEPIEIGSRLPESQQPLLVAAH